MNIITAARKYIREVEANLAIVDIDSSYAYSTALSNAAYKFELEVNNLELERIDEFRNVPLEDQKFIDSARGVIKTVRSYASAPDPSGQRGRWGPEGPRWVQGGFHRLGPRWTSGISHRVCCRAGKARCQRNPW